MICERTAWLGDQSSFDHLHSQVYRLMTDPSMHAIKAKYDSYGDDDDDHNPITLERHDNLAVITLSGSITPRSSWWTRYLGIPTYQDLRDRLTGLADDGSVKGILLMIDSTGGTAEGCFATAKFVRNYSDSIKTVFTMTESKAFSAGYALLVSGARVMMSEDASVGSIGAVMVHADLTKYFEQLGIKHTVFRSAPYKALGLSVEKLTDTAKKEMEDEISHLHDRFVDVVASMRRLEASTVSSTIANGRTYFQEDALKFKMVDHVLSFEQTVSRLRKALEKQSSTYSDYRVKQ